MTRRRAIAALALPLALGACAGPSDEVKPTSGQRLVLLRRFEAEEARQAVAVDALHFYAIDDRRIGKYDKHSGVRTAELRLPEAGPIVHLNSGIVLDGILHCAHSNYPGVPMRSSIESFDTATLAHVASHDFGVFAGSATWIDRRDGRFWVAFANYAGRGGTPGRGPEATSLVRFDAQWRPQGSLSFPAEVVRRFGDRSSSGGAFGPGGLLYATGHDAPELYVLRAPRAGTELELVEMLPAAIAGQGIAFDPAEPDVLWTILRASREVVALRLLPAP